MIAVKLDSGCAMPKALEGQPEGDTADNLTLIEAEGRTENEICGLILQADVLDPPAVTEQQRKCARLRFALLSVMILAVIIAGVVSFGIRTQGWFSPNAKRLMLRSWMRGDLTILEQLLH